MNIRFTYMQPIRMTGDWKQVGIYMDLNNTPLEIKTDETLGSKTVTVKLYSIRGSTAGEIELELSSTPSYHLLFCSYSYSNIQLPDNLWNSVENIWRLTLTKVTSNQITDKRLKIHCNGVAVVNVLLSDTCDGEVLRNFWSEDVGKIIFETWSSSSLYYRAGQTGIYCENRQSHTLIYCIYDYDLRVISK